MEPLRLHRRIGRNAASRTADRHGVAITGFDPAAVALPVKACGDLIAERGPIGREPVVAEGERTSHVGGTPKALAVDTGLEGIAAPTAKALR